MALAVYPRTLLPWTLRSWFRPHSGSGAYAGAETKGNIHTSGFGKERTYER